MKAWFFKIHGWLALVFAAPLAVLCVTGLILGLEPIFQYSSVEPGSLPADEIVRYLKKHDPEGKARGISHRAYETTLVLDGVGPEGELEIDLVKRDVATDDGSWYWSDFFRANRRLHEHVSIAGIDLTVVSTYAMLVIIALGVFLGLPRIRNTVSGWHKAVAWYLLPFLIISPLTGVFMAAGITLNTAAPQGERPKPLPLVEAVQVAGKSHDLSNMIWLRQRGGRQMIRLWDGQEARAYAVTKDGLQPLPRNFSRLIHEGNFLGIWSGMMKVITALGFIVLMPTGLWLFFSKQIRKYQNRKARAAMQASGSAAR